MTVAGILAGFSSVSALVVGDICLDRWCTYDPDTSEPSRETGIPRIGVVKTEVTPGGGATVANNLAALKAQRVAVLGVSGDDGHGYELVAALEARGISTELLLKRAPVPTFAYTKLVNLRTGIEDQPRVDHISTQPLPAGIEREILTRLESAVTGFDVIFVADQAETGQGAITPAVRSLVRDLATRYPRKLFWIDSRKHIEEFRGVVVKPNRQEADEACLRAFGQVDYERLREHIASGLMMVTMGAEGVLVIEPGRTTRVETAPAGHPVDICGAGDSFSAGAAVALALNGSPVEAARFGNLIASITIMKKGTGTATPAEVLAAEASGWAR
jgi:rfaE bifunctional protein kinase chain/domain